MAIEPPRPVKLTVYNDLLCVYCFCGFSELNAAIRDFESEYNQSNNPAPIALEVEYKPYKLVPALSEDVPVDRASFYARCLGPEKLEALKDTLKPWEEREGIKLSWQGPLASTNRAHRLSMRAYQLGGQKAQLSLLQGIFHAYTVESKNVSDIDVLSRLAADVGFMTYDETTAFLHSDALRTDIENIANDAKMNGITGIPTTIIDGKWAVAGSQGRDVYLQIFKKLAACVSGRGDTSSCAKPPPGTSIVPLPGIVPANSCS